MDNHTIQILVNSDVRDFISGLNQAKDELGGFEQETNQVLGRVESSFSKFGKNLTKIGAGLTASLTVPLTMVGKNIWDDGMEFDQQMSRVKAIGQLQEDQYNRLKDQALKVGADTIFGATDVAISQEGMLKKGFSIEDVEVAVSGVMNLATLDESRDVDLASDTMTSILNAYALKASEANRVSDILAQGTISTALDVRSIGHAMGYVGSEASSFNVSIEETLAMLGLMADRGVDGSKGGTTLRSVFNKLRTPTDKAGKALESLGIKVYDAAGKARPMFDILDDMNKSFKGMKDSEIDSYLGSIFGIQASTGMRHLLGDVDELRRLTKEFEGSEGVAQQVSEDLMSSTSGSVEEAMGAIESANIAMFEALAPVIVDIANAVEKLADAFSNLPQSVQSAIGYIGIFLWGIGPFLTTVGLAITGLEKLAGMFKLFTGAGTVGGGGALATVVTAVASILAVIAAGWFMTANWEKIKDKFGEFTSKIGDNFGKLGEKIQPEIDKIIGKFDEFKLKVLDKYPEFERAFEGITDTFKGFGTVLEGVWETAKGLFKFLGSQLIMMTALIGGFTRGVFTGEWDGFFNTMGDIFSWTEEGAHEIFGGLGTIFEGLGDIVLGKAEAILGMLDGLWTTFTDWTNTKMEELIVWVAEKMLELWTPIAEWWDRLIGGISTWWAEFQDRNSTWFETIAQGLALWLLGLWESFINWKDNVLATIQEWWNGVVEWFSNLPSAVRTHVDEFKETVSSGFKEAVDKAVEWVSGLHGRLLGFWEDMKSAGSSLVSGFISGLRSNAEGIWSAAKDMASNALTAVKSRLDINSPSGVGIELGGFFGEGLIRGINGTYGDVRSVSEGLANVISGQFGGNIGGFTDGINGMIAHSVGASVNVDEFEQAKQPIIIQTRFGNEDYEVYVEDITRTQDRQSWIKRR